MNAEREAAPVRELLDEAVAGVGPVAGAGTAELFAAAARVRRRRRATATAGVAALVAAGAVLAPQLGSPSAPPQRIAVAAQKTPAAGGVVAAAYLEKLLPGAGDIRSTPLEFGPGKVISVTPVHGALEGTYAVRKGGGTGFVLITLMSAAEVKQKLGIGKYLEPGYNPCPELVLDGTTTGCTNQLLPQGRLTTYQYKTERNGRTETEYTANLLLPDGRRLSVLAGTGLVSLGRPLATPALTRAELRTLALDPKQLEKP
ncbi:hypothetical protein ACIQGZ_06475 [Streptomyces sp. NPDC092296]|uniref:hypothetical protein n=1 Tax=Streptomyces sp. NPDC092296 TaxID=3366012 RepID=UPI00382C5FA1